jgi:ribosome assembly protein YihI (activator of Der GTPase)
MLARSATHSELRCKGKRTSTSPAGLGDASRREKLSLLVKTINRCDNDVDARHRNRTKLEQGSAYGSRGSMPSHHLIGVVDGYLRNPKQVSFPSIPRRQ